MDQIFLEAFEELIGIEGGYVNDPDDPGGETKYGISKRSYPHLDIARLTLEEAEAIYKKDFWDYLRLDDVYDNRVKFELFEQAVNFGQGQAAMNVQAALNLLGKTIKFDGIVGSETIKAINTTESVPLLKTLNGLQFGLYAQICRKDPSQKKFFVGWLKRVDIPRPTPLEAVFTGDVE